MSNLYRTGPEDDVNYRVIDTNDLFAAKLREHEQALRQKMAPGEFVAGLDMEYVEGEGDYSGEMSDGMDALFADGEQEMPAPYVDHNQLLEEAQEEAQRIVEAAQNHADMILSDAKSEVETLYKNTEKQAREQGLREGREDAAQELNAMRQDLENERIQMQQQMDIERAQMESVLVDVILDVFESVFCIQFADKKDLLLHMISNTLKGIDGAKQFTIKVPPERMREMEENKPLILEQVGSGITMDVMADSSLHDSDCVIETENGIFECGPLLQLDNLIRDMKALSLTR